MVVGCVCIDIDFFLQLFFKVFNSRALLIVEECRNIGVHDRRYGLYERCAYFLSYSSQNFIGYGRYTLDVAPAFAVRAGITQMGAQVFPYPLACQPPNHIFQQGNPGLSYERIFDCREKVPEPSSERATSASILVMAQRFL